MKTCGNRLQVRIRHFLMGGWLSVKASSNCPWFKNRSIKFFVTNKAHIVDDCGVKQWFHFKHSIAAKIFIYVYLFTDLGFFKLVKFRLFTSVKHRRRLVTKKNKAPECEWAGWWWTATTTTKYPPSYPDDAARQSHGIYGWGGGVIMTITRGARADDDKI